MVCNKMDKVFYEKDLTPMGPQYPGLHSIRHKEFNEFIKGKCFKGRNNYRLADLKAIFGFKPIVTGSQVTISSNGTEPTRFDSMSKASTSTGIPYATLLYAKKNSRKGATSVAPGAPECSHRVRSNGKEYTIIYH